MQPKIKNAYISSRQMRASETNAEYFGISLIQLMEVAGYSVAQEVIARFPKGKKVTIFCGLGGNGGDGFVAARHLLAAGFDLTVILVGNNCCISHKAALKNYNILTTLQDNISIIEISASSPLPNLTADIVIDALLGTGTKGKLRPPITKIVDQINAMRGFKIAVDVPTGVDSDTGDILGTAVKADLTVTFHKAKGGLENAKRFTGEILVSSIGLPTEMELFAGPGDVLQVSKPRKSESHKGDFGRLLVIGGSEVYSGAPALASLAAMRTGIDLVYLATPEKNAYEISSISPDLITIKLEGNNLNLNNLNTIKPFIEMVDAIVIGPGMGLEPETQEFVKACIEEAEKAGKPLLLDADGLKAYAKFKRPLKVPLILTPHGEEFRVLMDEKLPNDQKERIAMIKNAAKKLGATLIVKGKVDIISNGESVKLNFTGNAGMTVGGTGDVLSGIVGGLIAQHVNPFEASVAGAFVNGAAGDFVAEKIGFHMVATDLIDWIPGLLDDPMSHKRIRK